MVKGNEKPYLIRKTSTNSYIFRMNDKTAIGYFDINGDLVVETYDDNLDTISITKYTVVKE